MRERRECEAKVLLPVLDPKAAAGEARARTDRDREFTGNLRESLFTHLVAKRGLAADANDSLQAERAHA